ncbi:MAG: alpha/beta fold hydrolase [Synechococcaceae cyanobacterium]|nr:alpha/beta fold hydrolase [Synechococcaceae cyanobacterium]
MSEPAGPQDPALAEHTWSWREHTWSWRGHTIRWVRAGSQGSGPVVVLIHGFGANLHHWRHTLPALALQAEVYALDLLGFGASSKPRSRLSGEADDGNSVRYCFDLWAEQVVDFLAGPAGASAAPVHLIGNSIGGMVALNAAVMLTRQGRPPAQVILIDCAQRTLDDRRAAELPAWERASRPLLKGLVRQRWLIAPLFLLLAQPPFIRQVLRQAYPSGAHIDAELVELLHRPSTEPGARESFRGFVNLFADHLAPDLLAQLSSAEAAVPVRMLWGEADPWEDPAVAHQWLASYTCVRELVVLPGLGHCPHDEAPEQVNPVLQNWLRARA